MTSVGVGAGEVRGRSSVVNVDGSLKSFGIEEAVIEGK